MKTSLVSREERRLRVVFQRAVLVAVAGIGCGTTTIQEVVTPSEAGAPDAMADAGTADGPSDAGPPDKCAATVFTPKVVDTCGDYYSYPCGLPTTLTVRGDCYFSVNDCNSLCQDIHYNCHAIQGYCSTNQGDAGVPPEAGADADTEGGTVGTVDGYVIPDEAGVVVIDCSVCPGSAGRAPAGLAAAGVRRSGSLLGAYFAHAARLEAASVTAFRRLRDELAQHGAPSELLLAARDAERDEARHTLIMARLARRHGARYERPVVADVAPRSLAAIAEENVVEGCARETFSAILATYQGVRSDDPEIANALAGIADDEARHAALSWAIARWSLAQLDAAGRARIAAAWNDALDGVAGDDDPRVAAIAAVAQLPSLAERRLLAAQLRGLWSELASDVGLAA